MANYNEIFVSNVFKTKDNDKVQEVLNNVFDYSDLEDEGVCFGQLEDDNTFDEALTILFKGDEIIATYNADYESMEDFVDIDEDTSDYKEIKLIDFLQDMLLDGEYITITVIGWEKLRYVGGYTVVIDKNNYLTKSLYECTEDLVKFLEH